MVTISGTVTFIPGMMMPYPRSNEITMVIIPCGKSFPSGNVFLGRMMHWVG